MDVNRAHKWRSTFRLAGHAISNGHSGSTPTGLLCMDPVQRSFQEDCVILSPACHVVA